MSEDFVVKARSTTPFQLALVPTDTLAGGVQPVRRAQRRFLRHLPAVLIMTCMRCNQVMKASLSAKSMCFSSRR